MENTPNNLVLCPSCRGMSQEFHARRTITKQSLQVCPGPRLAEQLLVYLPPISIAWVCSHIPGSPSCSHQPDLSVSRSKAGSHGLRDVILPQGNTAKDAQCSAGMAEEPAQHLGCQAEWWHHCWWMEGALHQQRV